MVSQNQIKKRASFGKMTKISYAVLPLAMSAFAFAINSEDQSSPAGLNHFTNVKGDAVAAASQRVGRRANYGYERPAAAKNSEEHPGHPYRQQEFKDRQGASDEYEIKPGLFNCASTQDCMFSIYAGAKVIFPTGDLAKTYTNSAIPVVTIGAEKAFYQYNSTRFKLGAFVDYFGYSSVNIGVNKNPASSDNTSKNDSLYTLANVAPYLGIEEYYGKRFTLFLTAGPELQYRSLVIQNSVTTQPLDYSVQTVVGLTAEIGSRWIMPVNDSFHFFIRPAGGFDWGPTATKTFVFQSVANTPQSVNINGFAWHAGVTVGGEF